MVRRPRQESAVGTIRAVYEAVVASKILARVEEVRVKAGQEVKQGDVLVVLDKADLKSRIEQAQAAETSAKAKYDQAEIELGRAQRLRSRESITQSELDQANTAFRTAKAELERAQQAVEEARIVEAYATVRAPITGRVIDKKVNAGDTVSPGQASGHDVRPQPHADDRHGAGIAGPAAQGRPGDPRAARHAGVRLPRHDQRDRPRGAGGEPVIPGEGHRAVPTQRLQRHVRPDLHPAGR